MPAQEAPFEAAPDLPDDQDATSEVDALDPRDRLARWQRKLLDLSLRNNLLNFRATKKALHLEAPDPGALEDTLSSGQPLKLLPRPDLMDGQDPRSQAIHEARTREDVRRQHALEALDRRELFLRLDGQELESRLVELFRGARTTLQEGGANTLYLAVGFLSWSREKGGAKHKAPLVLVPVSLSRRSARSGFTLTLHEDEPRFNPTLVEMLRQDFRLSLPMADGELPRDENGLDIEKTWNTVSSAVRDIEGWEVTSEVVLSTFSFAKYLMWKDLTERTEQLRQNAVVRHLIDTPRDPYPSSVAFPDPRGLDAELAPQQTFCPFTSDSSQLAAVVAAARGKDFVLIGPPGTGKSQTITNVIAQCLAEGKRVLFVSEKIAALDVVYRRLHEAKLSDFCLELHSSKARKADVLAQLQRAWEAQGNVSPDEWLLQAERLRRQREALNAYVERLHLTRGNGLTIYHAIGVVASNEDVAKIDLSWSSADSHSRADLEAIRDLVDRLCVNAEAVGQEHLVNGPLAAVGVSEWSPAWQHSLIAAGRALIPVAESLSGAAQRYCTALSLPAPPLDRRSRAALAGLARCLAAAAGHDWGFAVRADAAVVIGRVFDGLSVVREHHELNKALSPIWADSVLAQSQDGLRHLRRYRQLHAELDSTWLPHVVSEFESGLDLIGQVESLTASLSIRYTDTVEQLNVHQLAREWGKASQGRWPISWWKKRAIAKILDGAAAGDGTPDVGQDLKALVRIRDLKSEIAKIDIAAMTDGLWAGIKTRKELAQTSLRFQEALAAAREHQTWGDDQLELIANGACGARLAKEYARMKALREVDAAIGALDHLHAATSGLWKGHSTDFGNFEAAILFNQERALAATRGPLRSAHALVASGACGERLSHDFRALQRRTMLEEQLGAFADLRSLTHGLWAGLDTKAEEAERVKQFHASIIAAAVNLARVPEEIGGLQVVLEKLLDQGAAALGPAGHVTRAGAEYVAAWGALQPGIDKFAQIGAFAEKDAAELSDVPLVDLIARCSQVVASEQRLHAWCSWCKVRDEALALGLRPLVTATESGSIVPKQLRRTFETNYCRWWLDAVVDNEAVIRAFVSAEHEKRIGDFRRLDEEFVQLTRSWVRAKLCAGLPTQDSVSRSSEWGILRNEINKKKRHMPLRELITSIPGALTKLTPCLLMSPLSVAQYLPPDASTFDVVVFDEASQIPVWDAIGAIARGQQVVMVGDPKQLPPTSFFDRAESSLDDEDVEADLESILDECMGANLPTMNLSWHYRSRHESLIAFSNHNYYGGSLVTFPSPATIDQAVSFNVVPGVYEKGGARINKVEAKALVADIVARLKSPAFRESGLTVGVVTFNSEQMTLIENLLDDERRRDPALEEFFDDSALEPVFVKNLESVQGDERDIMYFSITYGPDLTGAVSMNFGPMNREGGERRLNVAITRAREELRVFSSLKPEQMDLARTQAVGVRDLKHFLEFAERGSRALAESTRGSLGGYESPFEEAVAAVLRTKGWQVHTQIGASTFRIDLAVVHPDANGLYLAGVECDGATYHRSATARDRDLLREQVLRGLGWTIIRVWSTDWWIDRGGTVDKLHAALEHALVASRVERERLSIEEQAADAARAVLDGMRDGTPATDERPLHQGAHQAPLLDSASPRVAPQHRSAPAEVYMRNAAGPDGPNEFQPFVEADPATVAGDEIMPNLFFERSYDRVLQKMIQHVVDTEGPVLDTVLARRIARAHGWQRTGGRIQDRVSQVARTLCRHTEEDVGIFFWSSLAPDGSVVRFRAAGDTNPRSVDEICLSELISLAKAVTASGLSGDGAVGAMAKQIGLQRLRVASRVRLEHALSEATRLN